MAAQIERVFEQDRYQRMFEKGVELWSASAYADAKTVFRTILRDKPNHSETLRCLSLTIRKEGQLQVAKDMLERAIRANPANYKALSNLANLLIEANDLAGARRSVEQSMAIDPDFGDNHVNLGLLAMRDGKDEEAIAHFERALVILPESVVAKMNMATCKRRLSGSDAQQHEVDALQAAVDANPEDAKAHCVLALALEGEKRTSRALIHAYRACQLDANANNLSQLAALMCSMGDFEQAMPLFRRGVELAPFEVNNVASYLFAMNYFPDTTQQELYETYVEFANRFLGAKKKFKHNNHAKIAGRKIRIGYSSPDFRAHALYYFINLIFPAHDRAAFELFAYSNTDKHDEISEEIKGHFDHWCDVSRLSDEQMAQRIFEDGIDVLVDLAGHSRGNRLRAFALRPAPVQASYLGYGYTTGLNDIDYFIGDENLAPEEADPYFSEKVWRVPAPAYAYCPPPGAQIEVSPLPALKNGYVTFGSMSRLIRLNDGVLAVWKQVLDRVPGSKLRLDALQLGDAETRDLFLTRLGKAGFRPGQLDLGVTNPHWKGYAAFDISLDCWPHNTGTTTLDSLWMGVPVVSILARPSVGRFGATFLRPVGLDDWIAGDIPTYIEKAVAFASDLPALAALRASLRERMLHSSLMQKGAMAAKLEVMYREVIERFERGT